MAVEAEGAEGQAEESPKRSSGGRLRQVLAGVGLFCLFVLMALGTTWPLVLSPANGLPLGTYDDATIPYTMAWSLWWVSDALAGGLIGIFDAPIFHPLANPLAFSEPVTFLGLLFAPVSLAGASPALVHNLALWLCLALNGLAAHHLLRYLRLHRVAAIAGGAMIVLLPAVHQEIGFLALTPLFGVLWTMLAMVRFSREPTKRRGVVVALCFVMTFLLSLQYALFLALSALPASLMLLRLRHIKPRGLVALVTLLVVLLVFIAPLSYLHGSTLGGEEIGVSPADAARGSASMLAWLTVPWRQFVMASGLQVASEPGQTALFPGIFKLLVALLGLIYGLRKRHLRRATLFFLFTGLFAGFWSVAAALLPGEGGTYARLQSVVPGLGYIGSPWRAGIFAQIAVVLLAALGLQRILRTRLLVRRPGQGEPAPVRGLPLVVIIVLVLVTEIFPGAQRITHPPSLPEWAPVGEWIAENIPEEEIIAVAPVPMTDDRAEYEEIARWMYLQPALGRAMVNGYAPHRPKGHQAFAEAMRGFPSDEANVVLDERGARWLLTTSPILKSRIVSEGPKTGWARMFTYDDLGVVVHERITP